MFQGFSSIFLLSFSSMRLQLLWFRVVICSKIRDLQFLRNKNNKFRHFHVSPAIGVTWHRMADTPQIFTRIDCFWNKTNRANWRLVKHIKKTSSRGGLVRKGVRFSFSKFGESKIVWTVGLYQGLNHGPSDPEADDIPMGKSASPTIFSLMLAKVLLLA